MTTTTTQPGTLTTRQIAWARSHDWFVRDNGDGSITCLDVWTNVNVEPRVWHEDEVRHHDFQALRDWAGY